MSDYADLIAEFAAKGGKTQKIAEGARAYDPNDIYNAMREGGRAMAQEDKAEQAAHKAMDAATEARLNGHRVTGYDSNGNVYIGNGYRY